MAELEMIAFQELKKKGLIDEARWRNYKIRTMYNVLISEGTKAKKAREILAEEFCIGEKTIEAALYAKDVINDN